MKKVAFICVANACRSQIAQGLSKILGRGIYEAHSAGIAPLGSIFKGVYTLMARRGIDISDQYSKGIDDIPLNEMDFVITMGCCPADKICPIFFTGKKIDWDIPDPYGMGMDEVERVAQIIEKKIRKFIRENFMVANPTA